MKHEQKITYITLSVIAICLLGLFALAKFGGKISVTEESARKVSYEEDHYRGKKDAAVSVVEYADFQCPACAATEPLMEELIEKYGDRVGFVFRHFPLSGHDEAYKASIYAEAAHKQGKFFALGKVLYAKQSEWGDLSVSLDDKITEYASSVGLNVDQLLSDAKDPSLRVAIDRGLAYGTKMNIPGTPTIFVNGEMVTSAPRTVEAYSALIDAALASSPAGSGSAGNAFATLAVFYQGKRLALSSFPVDEEKTKSISFANSERTVIRRDTQTAGDLKELFVSANNDFSDECVSISGVRYCAKQGGKVELYVDGLRTRVDCPGCYVPEQGDRMVVSIASPNNAAILKEIEDSPVLPCDFGGDCE